MKHLISLILSLFSFGTSPTPTTSPTATPSPTPSYTPQFVLLSFDGSYSQKMWQDTLDFAKTTPVKFTYFVSGVYFTTPNPSIPSLIGYANSQADIQNRLTKINRALSEGHEIGSHANGHFPGGTWSAPHWTQEFDQFAKLVPFPIVGFRAPLLSRNNALYEVLATKHFLYDASGVDETATAWPTKNPYGTWLIPLADIPLANTHNKVLSMDYNFFIRQTAAKDSVKKTSPQWQVLKQQMLDSYLAYFHKNYTGNRAPVVIGHHFSLWNDGVYWAVMQDFAKQVCSQPQVTCSTFSSLVTYLNSHPHPL